MSFYTRNPAGRRVPFTPFPSSRIPSLFIFPLCMYILARTFWIKRDTLTKISHRCKLIKKKKKCAHKKRARLNETRALNTRAFKRIIKRASRVLASPLLERECQGGLWRIYATCLLLARRSPMAHLKRLLPFCRSPGPSLSRALPLSLSLSLNALLFRSFSIYVARKV